MDFDLSKPQKLLKETARQFLGRECKAARVRQLMETDTSFDPALWRAIADQGWTGLIVPEPFGGLGTGVVELAAVAEEMGRACLPGPFLSTLFAAALIQSAGGAEQKARYLEPIAAGDLKATVAILEEGANWNLDSVRMTTSGRKLFVGDAAMADLILCVTRQGVIPVEPARASIKPMRTMDDTRKLYEVAFDRLDTENAWRGDGVQTAIDLATVALCAEMVGGMQWILDTTVEYAKTRQQFGRAIGSFQAVQHQCADMLLMTESARSATYYAAWALTENDPGAPAAVSIAKAYCSDAYREVANRGVQVHGGIGFTWEHDLQLYYKRSKSSETLFGDASFHRERIATLIVDELPRTAARLNREPATAAAS
ncbi:MAG TPA: acyl-CoA dehydrogenase family protein [Thermoanaerobaculia bacterium]|nr:acyl-CoA dehydrogenase family protein [Thermoanaerobaculia bacterium]